MNIPEEIVEKAAEALRETGKTHPRTRSMDGPVQLARAQARAALSAAAPYLMARALREAADDIDIGQDTANHHATVAAESWLLDRANELDPKESL